MAELSQFAASDLESDQSDDELLLQEVRRATRVRTAREMKTAL